MWYKYDDVERVIYLVNDKGELDVLEDNFPSEPILSASGDKIAYISPDEWECISKVFLFNLKNGKEKILIDPIDDQSIPKNLVWLNDNELVVIIGHAYGTVAVGGNVIILNINKNTTKYITSYPPEIQATKINLLKEDILQIEGIEYIDENFVSSQKFVDKINMNDD